MAQVFFMSPIYHIVGFAKLSRQLDRGPLDRFRSVGLPTLSKDNQKARLNALAVLGRTLFVL